MEFIAGIDIMLMFKDIRKFLEVVIQTYDVWVYAILFVIIFCETGFVITPFLPGDSMLFAAGAVAASFAANGQSSLDIKVLIPLLCLAPILGDSTNYWIGRFIGPKIFHKEKVRFLNKEYLHKAHEFYQRHGGKSVAIGRFLPIIRTFVPFVAGIGTMPYLRFVFFSVIGTLAWINTCVLAGFFMGNIEFVKKRFELVVILIIIVSLIPALVGYLKARVSIRKKNAAPATQEQK